MKITPYSFFTAFPSYIVPFNLNEFYLFERDNIPNTRNPIYLQRELIRHKLNHGVVGGYGENRKDVWAGTYLSASKKFIHLGVDINMRVGTPVVAPFDAQLVDVFRDEDTGIGWGGRLILEKGNKYLVLAHLDLDSLVFQKSPYITQGQKLGEIGTFPTNGNVFEHLHVQALKRFDFDL
jgi:murein DD-endopeptidase MepM/ murein hydrolase activator NlpD